MPAVTDRPPPAIREDLAHLEAVLDEELPARRMDQNLLIATWNIRHFGGLTEQWVAKQADSPKRDLQSIRSIAAVISRFDVVAIQEIRGDLKALRHTLKVLGDDWGLVLTDVTRGDPGNNERLGFLFDRRRVQMSGLAAELVLPAADLTEVEPGALDRQFARTPYAVSFRSGGDTFILVTMHVLYGSSVTERTPELRAIARWLDEWAQDVNSWGHNLIALGDFNIDRHGDARYEAFTSTGLEAPASLHEVPRTIFGDPDDSKFYDQIAWFTGEAGQPALTLNYQHGGFVDFVEHVLPRRELGNQALSWRISDHYPLWVEFLRG